MDSKEYNGWPNKFTWQVYTSLSSDYQTYTILRDVVDAIKNTAEKGWKYKAADHIKEYVTSRMYEWSDERGRLRGAALHTLFSGLLNDALNQVDWGRVAEAFDES